MYDVYFKPRIQKMLQVMVINTFDILQNIDAREEIDNETIKYHMCFDQTDSDMAVCCSLSLYYCQSLSKSTPLLFTLGKLVLILYREFAC